LAFTQKLMQASISLGGSANTFSGLRMSATIEAQGATENGLTGNMELAIWGMPLSLMNQLTTLGANYTAKMQEQVELSAGDSDGMFLVFVGDIIRAYVDAQNMPLVAFRLYATSGGPTWSMKPVPPISLSGPQDVAQMLQRLAKQMGMTLENNGVNVKLRNPYYGGSPWQQASQIARHAGINMIADRNTLAIMPGGQARKGDVVLVSPQTGMVGYPMFEQASLIVKCEFNPNINPMGQIQVKSDLTPACGKWNINKTTYELECFMPHGRWFQTMVCTLEAGAMPP
jgi:hypothetical protein